MEQISMTIWASSAVTLIALVAITSLALRQLSSDTTKRMIAVAAWVLACLASGVLVRALVGWQANNASSYVVPGPVATWLPAVAAVAYAAFMVARKARPAW